MSVALALLVGTAVYMYATNRKVTKGAAQLMDCQEKYCAPFYQIHVDPAIWTGARDDRMPWQVKAEKLGATGVLTNACGEMGMAKEAVPMDLQRLYNSTKTVLFEEARSHPGYQEVISSL